MQPGIHLPQQAATFDHANTKAPGPRLQGSFARTAQHPPEILMANSSGMNTYIKYACNSSEMNTYKNKGLKVTQNEHLQKKGGVGGAYCYVFTRLSVQACPPWRACQPWLRR